MSGHKRWLFVGVLVTFIGLCSLRTIIEDPITFYTTVIPDLIVFQFGIELIKKYWATPTNEAKKIQ